MEVIGSSGRAKTENESPIRRALYNLLQKKLEETDIPVEEDEKRVNSVLRRAKPLQFAAESIGSCRDDWRDR